MKEKGKFDTEFSHKSTAKKRETLIHCDAINIVVLNCSKHLISCIVTSMPKYG